MIFDTPKSVNQLTASEAAEAGLTRPKTTALMSGGYMPSFNLLGQFKRSESLDTLSCFPSSTTSYTIDFVAKLDSK